MLLHEIQKKNTSEVNPCTEYVRNMESSSVQSFILSKSEKNKTSRQKVRALSDKPAGRPLCMSAPTCMNATTATCIYSEFQRRRHTPPQTRQSNVVLWPIAAMTRASITRIYISIGRPEDHHIGGSPCCLHTTASFASTSTTHPQLGS
jgi:hypothetical protein